MLSRKLQTAGPLRSTSVTRLHSYYGPIRHPLAFGPLPGFAGYRTYLAPAISRRGEEGFSSCSACPCHRAVASTPPKWNSRIGQISATHAAFALTVAGSAFGSLHFRGHIHVHLHYGPMTRTSPRRRSSIGFRVLVSRHPAIQATELLTSTPAGLSPAEHASLSWTHNRTCRSPASGSRTGHHAFTHGRFTTMDQSDARDRSARRGAGMDKSRPCDVEPCTCCVTTGATAQQCSYRARDTRVCPSLP
ncbi:hypothetical protein LMG28727_07392 [Paraburkholderia kirstenboschensis]|nr:hypothetical protein LMG28727_07392 [Paraburkholderia kirstenboschensis]